MKKKFLTFLFSILFILPCAFILTACGGSGPKGVYLSQIALENPTINYGERFNLNMFDAKLRYSDGTEEALDLEAETPVEGLSWEITFTPYYNFSEEGSNEQTIDEIPEYPDAGTYWIEIRYSSAQNGNHQTQASLHVNTVEPESIPQLQISSDEFAWGDILPTVSFTEPLDENVRSYYLYYQQVDEEGNQLLDTDMQPLGYGVWDYEENTVNNCISAGRYRLWASFEGYGNYCEFETEPIFFNVTKAEFDASYELCKIEYDDGDPMYVPSTEVTINFQPGQTTLGQSYIGLDICKDGEWVIGSTLVWEHPEKSIDDLGATENVVMKMENFEDKVVAVNITIQKYSINEPWKVSLVDAHDSEAVLEVTYDGQEHGITYLEQSYVRGTGENLWTFYYNYYNPTTEEITLVPIFRATAASTFSATNAGDYSITFELLDKTNTIWSNSQDAENYVVKWSILPIESTSTFYFVIDGERYSFDYSDTINLTYKDNYSVSVVEVTENETEINIPFSVLSLGEYGGGNLDGLTLQNGVFASELVNKAFCLNAVIPQNGNTARVLATANIFIGTKVFTDEEKAALLAEVPHLTYSFETSLTHETYDVAVIVPDELIPTAVHEDGSWALLDDLEKSWSVLHAGDYYDISISAEDAPHTFNWTLIFTPNDPKFGGEYYYEVPITLTIENIVCDYDRNSRVTNYFDKYYYENALLDSPFDFFTTHNGNVSAEVWTNDGGDDTLTTNLALSEIGVIKDDDGEIKITYSAEKYTFADFANLSAQHEKLMPIIRALARAITVDELAYSAHYENTVHVVRKSNGKTISTFTIDDNFAIFLLTDEYFTRKENSNYSTEYYNWETYTLPTNYSNYTNIGAYIIFVENEDGLESVEFVMTYTEDGATHESTLNCKLYIDEQSITTVYNYYSEGDENSIDVVLNETLDEYFTEDVERSPFNYFNFYTIVAGDVYTHGELNDEHTEVNVEGLTYKNGDAYMISGDNPEPFDIEIPTLYTKFFRIIDRMFLEGEVDAQICRILTATDHYSDMYYFMLSLSAERINWLASDEWIPTDDENYETVYETWFENHQIDLANSQAIFNNASATVTVATDGETMTIVTHIIYKEAEASGWSEVNCIMMAYQSVIA